MLAVSITELSPIHGLAQEDCSCVSLPSLPNSAFSDFWDLGVGQALGREGVEIP